jgi:hypothetical protein
MDGSHEHGPYHPLTSRSEVRPRQILTGSLTDPAG